MELKCYRVGQFICGSGYWNDPETEELKICKTADDVSHALVVSTGHLERAVDLIAESTVWIYVPKTRFALIKQAKTLGFEALQEEPLLSSTVFTALSYKHDEPVST